jgi:hypothetical protein
MKIPSLVPSAGLQISKPVDVSVIIAHRGPEMGLWFTVESCIIDLERSGLTYEFRICANGIEKVTEDLTRIKHYTEKTGHLGEFLHVVQPMSPPAARQLVTENANGKYLFFFDNHCIPTPGYFRRGVDVMESKGIDFLHSTTRFFAGEGTNYEYKLSLKRDFWTLEPYREPVDTCAPYRIAVAGHGGFAVRNSAWKETGGYWQGFEGYGGEETYTDLKFWLLGKEVFIDPQFIHLHWAGERTYTRHFTDDYYRNTFMAARLIGGEQWLHTVFSSATKCTRFVKKDLPVTPMYELLKQAEKKTREHAKWIADRSSRTLDELLVWFKEQGIRT